MRGTAWVVVAAWAAGAVFTQQARAQSDGGVAMLGVLVGSMRSTRIDAATTTTDVVSGVAFGAVGRLRIWRAELFARYMQSDLGEVAAPQDLVEGEIALGVRPVRWLSLRVGPRVRAHVTENGRERWVFWEGRVRGDARLFGPSVRSYLEGWTSFSGTTNLAEGLQRAGGIEGGVIAKLPIWQMWVVASYRFDRASLIGATQVDATDQLTLALTFGGY